MRVTDRQIFESANARLGSARSRMEAATQEASTGLKVIHPGDDAAAAGQIVARRLDATRQAAIKGTVDAANDELTSTDGALDAIGGALAHARQLAVQLANPVYTPEQRAAAADEVDGLFKTVVAQLNTRVGQRYVFAGFQDATQPFTAAGAYQGDTGVRQVEIAPGVQQGISVRADVMIAGANGGTDVLATLAAMSTALRTNNVANVRNAIDGLDAGTQQVANARVQVGAAMVVLDAASTASRAGKDDAVAALSHLTEADAFEAATRLSLSQRGLEAAIQASAKSFQLTLLDKL